MNLPDAAGILGSIVIIVAYFGNLRGSMPATELTYPALNLAGAVLILISLWYSWNLAAALTEIFWAAISVYGLTRGFFKRRQPRAR
jgi:hypothetical protein